MALRLSSSLRSSFAPIIADFCRAKKEEAVLQDYLTKLPSLIYPNVPSPPLPLSLPLDNYTGTYEHPAYSRLTLYRNCSFATASAAGCDAPLECLIERGDVIQIAIVFKHVSSDYFLAYAKNPIHTNKTGELGAVEARFELDAGGLVKKLGVDLRGEGLGTELVWYNRVVT